VPISQTVNCSIYFIFLKVSRNAIQPINAEVVSKILITLHIHTPCQIFFALQQFFCHKTNCSLTKLHVTPVSYQDSRTDSILRSSPIREIQHATTAGPTAITNWTSRVSSTNGSTAVVKCVCVCVCVCVCAEGQYCVWKPYFLYMSCCIQIMYKFQEILYPTMFFSVQENMDLWLRKIY